MESDPLLATACRSNTIVTTDKPVEDEVIVEDADGDGYLADEDCDDQNAQIHPGVEEICDGLDNDCNGEIDEGVLTIFYIDDDGDGFGNPESSGEYCSPPEGYVPSGSDCDDSNPDVFIGNNEICDGIDNNCNDEIDEGVGDVYFVDSTEMALGILKIRRCCVNSLKAIQPSMETVMTRMPMFILMQKSYVMAWIIIVMVLPMMPISKFGIRT